MNAQSHSDPQSNPKANSGANPPLANHTANHAAGITSSSAAADPCGILLELIPAYSIGATDPDETAYVLANLAACPEAVTLLHEYEAVERDLLLGFATTAPPLADRVIATINAAKATQEVVSVTPTSPLVFPEQPAILGKRRFDWRWLAAAVVILLLGTGAALWSIRQAEQNRPTAIITVLRDSNAPRVVLTTTTDATNADAVAYNATFLYDTTTARAGLSADKWPPLPAGSTYQLWWVASGSPRSLLVFKPDSSGALALTIPNAAELKPSAGDVFAVTVEPEGGSPQPTMPILTAGTVG